MFIFRIVVPSVCGASPVTRVIGGVDAQPGNWPWQVTMLLVFESIFFLAVPV